MTALRAWGIAAAVFLGLSATALVLGLLGLLVSDEYASAVLRGAALTAWGGAGAVALVAPRKIEQRRLRERLESQRFDGRGLDRLVAWTEELRREADVAKMAGETRKTEER